MSQHLGEVVAPTRDRSLARSFFVLGWAGFWLQVVFIALPVIGMVYYFTFSSSSTPRAGIYVVEYLTLANLMMLVVTAFWSYRYTKIAGRLLDPQRRPPESRVRAIVWTGVVVSTVGMVLSMIVILLEAASLLFRFLRSPQAGVPVIQTGPDAVYWVSSVDMGSLMTLILTLFAELIVLVFSLRLLYRTTPSLSESPHAAATVAVTEQVA